MGILECVSAPPGKFCKYDPSAQMTMPARSASKFCARTRSECPEIFYLDLIHRGIPGMKEPWPECQSLHERDILLA